jgi:hypothetical protein
MHQPSLFDPPPPERAPPNLETIRKHMRHILRVARNAVVMPWHEPDARKWERLFPELAALLPPEEGPAMLADFQREMARLRAL